MTHGLLRIKHLRAQKLLTTFAGDFFAAINSAIIKSLPTVTCYFVSLLIKVKISNLGFVPAPYIQTLVTPLAGSLRFMRHGRGSPQQP